MSRELVLKNVSNVSVAPNEIRQVRHVINRNIRKLLENDIALDRLLTSILGELKISEYIERREYSYGELVWVNLRDWSKEDPAALPEGFTRDDCKYDPDPSRRTSLFLLRCVQDGNRNLPETGTIYHTFAENGWKNENESPKVKELLGGTLTRLVNQWFVRHVEDRHRFGKLLVDARSRSSQNYIDKKVLRSDLSNVDPDRARNFYPYRTLFLNADGKDRTVVSGQCRQYENGLLEYDIVFRLGFRERVDDEGVDTDVLSCNDVRINTYVGATASSRTKTDNAAYFLSRNDYGIFGPAQDSEVMRSAIDDTLQGNRNDYVNTYSGTIEFPVPFADRNYMIFSSDVTCQDRDVRAGRIGVGQNAMAWVNKSQRSVTPLYIVFEDQSKTEYGYNARNSGIVSNSFHCRIVGKWK